MIYFFMTSETVSDLLAQVTCGSLFFDDQGDVAVVVAASIIAEMA